LLCCVGKQRLPQSRPTPSRSHPSLVQSKLVGTSDKGQKKPPSAVSRDKPRSAARSQITTPKANIPVSSMHSKPDVSGKEVGVKYKSKPATTNKSDATAKSLHDREVDPLLGSPGSRRRQLADESIDVTTYLLHRMLGAPAQLPTVASQLADAVKNSGKDAEDKHSEAGTYTIDDEEDDAVKQSVEEARERIDDVFGISNGTENKSGDTSSRLVRPVIKDKHTEQGHIGPGGMEVNGDEDVFIDVDADDAQRQHYVCMLLVRFFFSVIATDGIAWSVCVSICLLVIFVIPAKTLELIEMLNGG